MNHASAALAGMLNGAPACTFGVFVNMVVPGSSVDFCAHTSDTGSYSHAVRHSFNIGGTGRMRFIEGAAGNTQYLSPLSTFPSTSGWQLYVVTSDGAGNIAWFLDGVLQYTTSGAHQSPAGLDNVVLGESSANAVGAKEQYIGGFFACDAQISAATQVKITNWFIQSFS
jgi:hypothetical protein